LTHAYLGSLQGKRTGSIQCDSNVKNLLLAGTTSGDKPELRLVKCKAQRDAGGAVPHVKRVLGNNRDETGDLRPILALLPRSTAESLCLFEDYEETATGRFQTGTQVKGGAGRQFR
jgi:hypothetical protein